MICPSGNRSVRRIGAKRNPPFLSLYVDCIHDDHSASGRRIAPGNICIGAAKAHVTAW